MIALSGEAQLKLADADNRRHHANRLPRCFEPPALLDMRFEIRALSRTIEHHARHIRHARLCERVAEQHAITIARVL